MINLYPCLLHQKSNGLGIVLFVIINQLHIMESNKNFDSQLQAYFTAIKHNIKDEHINYLKSHPELRQILNDFLSSCLLQQPENVYEYAKKFFSYFNYSKDVLRHKPLVITGCSGVGKGTLINLLIEKNPNLFELSISYTTRRPRQGEVHGREYYFVTKQEFEKEIEKKVFAEYCEVHGNYYGTHKGKLMDVMNRGKICLLDIDVQGGEKIHNNEIDCHFIFIDAPSIATLEERLVKRGTETQDVIQKRLNNAKKEIERGQELKFYHHITNDDIKKCYTTVAAYVEEKYSLNINK